MDKDKVYFSVSGNNYYLPIPDAIKLMGRPGVRCLLAGPPSPDITDEERYHRADKVLMHNGC